MTRLVRQAVEDARVELGDTSEGSHAYTQEQMLAYCGEAVIRLRTVRPSTRYDSAAMRMLDDDDMWRSTHAGMAELKLPFEDRYYDAVVAFIIYRCLSRDVTDQSNLETAGFWFQKFDGIARG